jgi:hypothetical protein
VKKQLLAGPRSPQGAEVKTGERVDEEVRAGDADLDEAKLLEVAVQRVRLGIHGDGLVRLQVRKHRREGLCRFG